FALGRKPPEAVQAELKNVMCWMELESSLTMLEDLRAEYPDDATLLGAVADSILEELDASRRAEVQAELETARSNGRPMRYSAGEAVPAAPLEPDRELAQRTKPWRRALALARRKRTAGD